MEKKKSELAFFWKVILRVYMTYATILFVTTFLLILPIFFLAGVFNWEKVGLRLNHYWAHVFFFLVGLPMEITYKSKLDKKANYIFCPNHFSFLDIAILPFVSVPFMFVGKLSIAKVPFFGYMFKRFHITVDRSTMRQKYATYRKSIDALLNGFSLAIFPEGGIKVDQPPNMKRFKEGPFRMAVETGTPIVPVTMADNWHIFPDDGKFLFRPRKCRMVIHEPIDPANYTLDRLKEFQEDVFMLMQQELNKLNGTSENSLNSI